MKMKCFTKRINLLLLGLLGLLPSLSAQTVQATIEPGVASNSVRLGILPSATISGEQLTNIQFSIAVPATVMPAPSPLPLPPGGPYPATGPMPGVTGLIPIITWSNMPLGISVGFGSLLISLETVGGNPHYVYTFNYTGLSAPVAYPGGVQTDLLEVAFSGCTSGCDPADVKLVSLASGGSTAQGYFYFETNSGDRTNFINPFYSGTGGTVVNSGDGYCCESYVGTSSGVDLPIELLTFEPRTERCEGYLYWETATERNFGYYQIETSRDGRTFIAIDQHKPPSPNSLEKRAYKYLIPTQYQGYYFRLKAVDLDATFEYSPVVPTEAPCGDKIYEVQLYPNPSYLSELTVAINSPEAHEQVRWFLTDNFGKQIQQGKTELKRGLNKILVPVENLPSGTYYIHLLDIPKLNTPYKFVRSKF